MRLMIVQYAGDYRQYYREHTESGESYHGHGYVLNVLEGIAQEVGDVAVLCSLSGARYEERLPNGLEVIGADAHPIREFWKVAAIIRRWQPTHLVIQGPMTLLIAFGLMQRYRLFVLMANSFESPRLERLVKYQDIARVLRNPRVEWIANHGINASKSLERIGVPAEKIIPWDWPYERNPRDHSPKELHHSVDNRPLNLFYAGSVVASKGIEDMLVAVARLRNKGVDVLLQIAGSGDVDTFVGRANELDVGKITQFLGSVPNHQVFEKMRAADFVLVPSRHVYPEGLPLTIYEALSSRTPIIASDHPMFHGHLVDRETAMVFPAGDGAALADCIQAAVDPELYAELSRNSEAAWNRMQNPTKWGDMLRHWLQDDRDSVHWLESRSMARVGTDTVEFLTPAT